MSPAPLSPAPAGADAWWRTAVVYQVWPRSFQDSDGDGVGDLRGVLARLDHLADLGVDVLWLSPVYPSPQVDAGYDISDHEDVDPLFGTLADLDELVAAVHARGMRLVLDVVLNHTSDQHPWFAASRSSRDDPRRSWYWWRPAGPDGGPPDGAQSLFSGSAWQLDPATGEYYLHTFAREQPDLDWSEPAVRAAAADLLRFWLDRGVDGFRFDVISMISKTTDDLLGFGPQLHEHLQELHREVFAGRDLLTVGETPGATVEQGRLLTDPSRRELDMVFQFEHVALDQGASKWEHVPVALPVLKRCLARWQEGLAGAGWNSLYWQNHDQPRVVSRYGDAGEHRVASAKALATVLHLHRGTPFVYQGEELGMRNAGFARLDDYRDVESLNHYRAATSAGVPSEQVLADLGRTGRDNARTPVPWDDGPHGGFTTGTPWIGSGAAPVPPASVQRGDPSSVLAHYRALIALRHQVPVVAHGDFALLLPDDEQVWAFLRRDAATELLVLANCSGRPAVADVPGWEGADVLLGERGGLALQPWESRVLQRPR